MIQGTMGSIACFVFLTFHHVWHVPTIEFMAVLFCAGSDPYVYLGFNYDIRADFLEIIANLFGWIPGVNLTRVGPGSVATSRTSQTGNSKSRQKYALEPNQLGQEPTWLYPQKRQDVGSQQNLQEGLQDDRQIAA